MDMKKLAIYGIAFIIAEILVSAHFFVTFAEMTAYAAPKDSVAQVQEQLNRIEHKIDKLILGY